MVVSFPGSVLYLHLAPKPTLPGTDAVYQESEFLRQFFPGDTLSLFPLAQPASWIPPVLYGWPQFFRLRDLQKRHILCHVFAPHAGHFKIIQHVDIPIVYSITTSITDNPSKRAIRRLHRMSAVVVNNDPTLDLLESSGLSNLHLIASGIDVSRLEKHRKQLDDVLHLLMASAPWESTQFVDKGVTQILHVLKKRRNVRMTFLWRGHLKRQMEHHIRQAGVGDQVRLIDEVVDINQILKEVHGTILLAKNASLVKAQPHSLLESLQSGKPVLISRPIALSNVVEKHRMGVVVESLSDKQIDEAIDQFMQHYHILAENAFRLPQDSFDRRKMIGQYNDLYLQVGKIR